VLREERPDLLLLDVSPGTFGGGRAADRPILMLAVDVPDAERLADLTADAGEANGQPGDVAARAQAVVNRVTGTSHAGDAIRVGGLALDRRARRAEIDGEPVHLTPIEFSLLCTLAERPGSTLTRLELIQDGLGDSFRGRERTVDSHVKNLRNKLEVAGGKGFLIETVYGVGYRLSAGGTG
jgi:DNA-binding response OmpR family regulator